MKICGIRLSHLSRTHQQHTNGLVYADHFPKTLCVLYRLFQNSSKWCDIAFLESCLFRKSSAGFGPGPLSIRKVYGGVIPQYCSSELPHSRRIRGLRVQVLTLPMSRRLAKREYVYQRLLRSESLVRFTYDE